MIRSPRQFPSRLRDINYAAHLLVKKVQMHGGIRYLGRKLFVTESLYGEYIGIEKIDNDKSMIWYYDYPLGEIDHRKWQITPAKSRSLRLAVQLSAQLSECNP